MSADPLRERLDHLGDVDHSRHHRGYDHADPQALIAALHAVLDLCDLPAREAGSELPRTWVGVHEIRRAIAEKLGVT